jgi:hypothetical protein
MDSTDSIDDAPPQGAVVNGEPSEKRPLWAAAERYKKIKKPFLWKEVAKEYALSFVPHTIFWYGRFCATPLFVTYILTNALYAGFRNTDQSNGYYGMQLLD